MYVLLKVIAEGASVLSELTRGYLPAAHGSCGRMVAAGYCCGRCPGLFTLGLFHPA
jgi:hypothetical protein